MLPFEIYEELKYQVYFPYIEGDNSDYIRGGLLVFVSLLGVGIPTLLGYLSFMVSAQLRDVDFLPPLTPSAIGDYTYRGFQYSVFIVVSIIVSLGFVKVVLDAPVSTTVKAVVLMLSMFLGLYVFPLTFVQFSKTGLPLPARKSEVVEFVYSGISYEYMTVFMLLIFSVLIVMTVFLVSMFFIVTIPVGFICIWFLSIIFTRMVGYAVVASSEP